MRTSTLLSILPLALLTHAQVPSIDGPVIPGTTGKLGNAVITQNNPVGVSYTATLPNSITSGIRGYVSGTSNANGTGVVFNVNLSGLPSAALGPFLYHIHDQPVPTNGSCAGTLAHLDPFLRGEIPPCDNTHPETCQVGDLAGKHGNITGSAFQAAYLDLYVSTLPGSAAFFGNRSIVIHTSNTTRLTCANFTLSAGTASSNASATVTKAGPTSTVAPYTGGAAAGAVGLGAVVAAGVALFL